HRCPWLDRDCRCGLSQAASASEELVVGGGGRQALGRTGLLAGAVDPLRLDAVGAVRLRRGDAGLEDRELRAADRRLALDRPDAIRHPLGGILEAMPPVRAARMDLVEARRLDPHPLAVEQARDALLARLGAGVLAVLAARLVVRRVVG